MASGIRKVPAEVTAVLRRTGDRARPRTGPSPR